MEMYADRPGLHVHVAIIIAFSILSLLYYMQYYIIALYIGNCIMIIIIYDNMLAVFDVILHACMRATAKTKGLV